MTDFEHIVPLWQELEASGTDYVLATVVAVEGSSYRKPGARMLLAADGRRAGTVSGGCLEAAVAKKAWWLTTDGPVVERYSTFEDDGDLPYGSGCGGVVYILLERKATAGPLLRALFEAFLARAPLSIATVLEGPRIGERCFGGLSAEQTSGEEWPTARAVDRAADQGASWRADLQSLADSALGLRAGGNEKIAIEGVRTRVWVDYRVARPGLWIFGAGDDAKPLVNLARELGWFVAVADGRSHLATRARFGRADEVHALEIGALPGDFPDVLDPHAGDAAVLVTHSFEQDSRILAWLMGRNRPLAYTGVLGPQRRTREVLVEAARLLGVAATPDRVEQWLAGLHAPTGLDLGAETPATVALSILSEIQKVLTEGTALPLREVRATQATVAQA